MMYLSALHAQVRIFLGNFFKSEQGVSALEYAIMGAGVAATVLAIFNDTGPVMAMFTQIYSNLQSKLTAIL